MAQLIAAGVIVVGQIRRIGAAVPKIQRGLAQTRKRRILSGLLVWNSTSGLIGLLAVFPFHRWSRHPKRAKLAAVLERSAAGSSRQRAQATLDEIKAIVGE